MSYPKLKNENEIYVKMKNYIAFTFSHHIIQSILKSTTSVSEISDKSLLIRMCNHTLLGLLGALAC